MRARTRSAASGVRAAMLATLALGTQAAHGQQANEGASASPCPAALEAAGNDATHERWAEVFARLEPLRAQCRLPALEYALGRSYRAAGRYRDARQAFRETLALAGERASAQGRAEIEQLTREADEAIVVVRVSIEPGDAALFVDGQAMSPAEPIELDPGTHTFEARREGHHEAREVRTLARGARASIALRLERAVRGAQLVVRANVSSAEISVDERVRGRGEVSLALDAGEHRVLVRAPSMHSEVRTVSLRDGEARELDLVLRAMSLGESRRWLWPVVGTGAALLVGGTVLTVVLTRLPYTGSVDRAVTFRP